MDDAMRSLAKLLASALILAIAAHSLPSSSLVLSTVALRLHGHLHSLAMVPDGDHVDAVFSHADEAGSHSAGDGAHGVSHSDHVFHLTAGASDRSAPRSVAGCPAAPSALAPATAPPAPFRVLAANLGPAPRDAARLRTVVLRL
jgi:hypothetical protein